MELNVKKKTFEAFPTFVYRGSLGEPKDLNMALKSCIREEQKRDQEGIVRSNIRSLGGWHSRSNLHYDDAYAEFTKVIDAFCSSIAEDWNYAENLKLEMSQLWAIINSPGSFNISHTHPGCLWSGAYYVQAPEDSGDIVFEEPRAVAVAVAGKFQNGRKPDFAMNNIHFTPVEGEFYIFPSWLSHHVEPNLSTMKGKKSERIVLSFNLMQKPR